MPHDVRLAPPHQRCSQCTSANASPVCVAVPQQPWASTFVLPALEDRARLLGIIDDERERRAVAPTPQEQVAEDVDPVVRELAGDRREATGTVLDLRQQRLAL